MCSRTALGAELYPGVLAAPLVLGTLGGTGGKFVGDVLLGGTGEHCASLQGLMDCTPHMRDFALVACHSS